MDLLKWSELMLFFKTLQIFGPWYLKYLDILNNFTLVPLILNHNRIGTIYTHIENEHEPLEKKIGI